MGEDISDTGEIREFEPKNRLVYQKNDENDKFGYEYFDFGGRMISKM